MINEWGYLFLAAVSNTILQFFWKKRKAAGIRIDGKIIALIFVGSFCAAWGIDVIQRGLEVMTIVHILKVSLGCWLMFAVSTAAKHYAANGWSRKQFISDYGGDLAGFLLMGLIIHLMS
jgi:hypothetical protein